MAVLSYKELIKNELGAVGLSNIDDLLDTYYARHSNAPNDVVQYLRVRYSLAKYFLGNSRNFVDTIIGFDTISASQVITNLKAFLDACEKDLSLEDPSFLGFPMASISPTNGLR
jgi:hypothetical protein